MSPRAPKTPLPTAKQGDDWGSEALRLDPQKALQARISATRPHPPHHLADDMPERFAADVDFAGWISRTFLNEGAVLLNPRHEHLREATIGVLWTNVINNAKMRHILGTAELTSASGAPWKRGRSEQQMREWFGHVPTFVLTFYAPDVHRLDDRSFCALVEHELLHCAQAEDKYGAPKFDQLGAPMFGMRGHDVEEFTDVVARYGPTSKDVRDMISAAFRPVLIGDGPIEIACGTCGAVTA